MGELQRLNDRLLDRLEAKIEEALDLKQEINLAKKEVESYAEKLDEYIKKDTDRRHEIDRLKTIIARQKKALDQRDIVLYKEKRNESVYV